MDKKEIALLFKALSRILWNQDKILKHIGLNHYDSADGWTEEATINIYRECNVKSQELSNGDDIEW